MRAGYGEATRAFLSGKNPKLLVDFGGLQVFESATVDTNILLVQNAPRKESESTLCCTVKGTKSLKAFDLSQYVKTNASPQAFTASGAWTILSPTEQRIKAKIEAAGVPLKDWEVSIYRGVTTGLNDAFIISGEKRDQILASCKSTAERARTERLIRKVLRGRDIRRYGYQWAGLYLIATFPACHYNIDDYPAVKEHLLSFGKERLEQTGATHKVGGKVVKARSDTGGKWFEIQATTAYWQDFDKPKIVWIELTDESKFAYSDDGIIPLNTAFFMVGESVEYVLAVINSALIHWYYLKSLGARSGAGTNRWLKYTVECIPIPRATPDEQCPIVELVRQVLAAKSKGEDTTAAERAIDRLVCDLYGLTEEERRAIGFAEIT